jgi:hypothetical protein
LGLENQVILCRHCSFSAKCLWRGLREIRDGRIYCDAPHLTAGLQIGDSLPLTFWDPRVSFSGGHTINLQLQVPFANVEVREPIEGQELDGLIQNASIFICSHTVSATLASFEGRPWEESSPCLINNCLTCYRLLRRYKEELDCDELAILVCRYLIGGPSHPSWKEQMSCVPIRPRKSRNCEPTRSQCQGECCLHKYKVFIQAP